MTGYTRYKRVQSRTRYDIAPRVSFQCKSTSGQLIGATVVAAPKQRNTQEEKAELKKGVIPDAWKVKRAKVRQKDRDARWTVKYNKAKVREEGSKPAVDLAIPAFGYTSSTTSP